MKGTFEHEDHWPVLDNLGDMYNGDFLINCSLFEGGFINFGYWKEFGKKEPFSLKERLESAKDLYRQVLKETNLKQNDNILEVACGSGAGSQLVLQEHLVDTYYGIDSSSSQIDRAKSKNFEKQGSSFFQVSSAESLPFKENFFDKVFSIEAAQHFNPIESFVYESYRVLKSNGKLVISTFFSLSEEASKKSEELIPTLKDGVDFLHPISKIEKLLKTAGFKNVQTKKLGEKVWKGFDSWVAQGEFKNSWDRNWYKGYQENLFDYFIISAEKD